MKIDNFTLAFIYFTIASIVLGGVSALGSFIIYTIKFEVFPLKKRLLAVLLPVFLLMYYEYLVITNMADLELPFWWLYNATIPPFLISFGLFFNILHRWLRWLEKKKERKAE